MAGRIPVQCPGCLATLNLPDSSKLGKKIRCPKCSDVFVAEAAEDEDFEDEEEAPAKSRGGKKRPAAAGKKGGGKKSKSSDGNNVPLIAGGAIAAVVLLVGGLYFAGVFGGGAQPLPAPPMAEAAPAAPMAPVAPPAPPAPPPVNPAERILALRWLPADTELLIHIKVAELWQAPLLKKLVDMPETAAQVQQMIKEIGMGPTDIESVTFGLGDLKGVQEAVMTRAMGIPSQTIPKLHLVFRTKKTLNHDDMMKALPQLHSVDHGTKKYIQNKVGPAEEMAGWVADSNTFIMAPVDQLKVTMDRGESTTPARKELLFADPAPHVVVILAPKDTKSLTQSAHPFVRPTPEAQEMERVLNESVLAGGLGISVRGGFDVQTALLFKDAESAGKVKAEFENGIAQGKSQFQVIKGAAPPLLAELGEMLLNNVKVENQNTVLKISTGLPDSVQQKLVEDLPPVLMVMAMTGGLGGGGNPFGPPSGPSGGPFSGPPGGPSGPSQFPRVQPGTRPAPPGAPPGTFGAFPEMKNPGQTEPVKAEVAEGIPEGTTLTASMSWSMAPVIGPNMQAVHPMQLMIDLQGDALSQICGAGQVSFKTSSLKGGGSLKVSRIEPVIGTNAAKFLVPFDVDESSVLEHPDGTLRLTVLVETPAGKDGEIEALEGTFKLLTAEGSDEYTIEEALKAAKRPLMDPELKAAGVKLMKSSGLLGEGFTLSCGKGYFLGKCVAIDPAAEVGFGESTFRPDMEKNQPVQRVTVLSKDGKIPETTQVQFKVHRGVKEKTVNFKFTGVAQPTAESKPKPVELNQPGGGAAPPNAPR
jgi:hypothetical protein